MSYSAWAGSRPFRAHDPFLQRDVAIKVMDPSLALSADLEEPFLRETRIIAEGQHVRDSEVARSAAPARSSTFDTSIPGLLLHDTHIPGGNVRSSWILMTLAVTSQPAVAQQTQPSAETSLIANMLDLPLAVEAAQRAGIPSGTIWEVLDSLRRRRVPAADAEQILRGEVEAVEKGGPRENFGAFVNAQLARGLRGRELAAAIHAEHARRGIGQGRGRGPDTEKGKAKGRGRGP